MSPETSAAAAAKLLQSCPTLYNPIDGSPPGSPVPGILWARTLEWVAMPSSMGLPNPRIKSGSPALWGSLVAQLVKTLPAGDRSWIPGSGRSAGEGRDTTPGFLGSPVAQLVKSPPAMRETWVRSLSWDDPLEKGKATHSSILAWRIPWMV